MKSDSGVRTPSFDVDKAVACVAVVLIHYDFRCEAGKSVKVFSTFAIPAFFMISGCFLPRVSVGENLPVEKIFGQVRKLFMLGIAHYKWACDILALGTTCALAFFANWFCHSRKRIKR